MYPDEATLIEVGRIAIAAGRLDADLGRLWWHLAPDQVDQVSARQAPAGAVRRNIEIVAVERLDEEHARALVALVKVVAKAQRRRNEVMHARWLLHGRDAMRPVGEFLALPELEQPRYLEDWSREARSSDAWQSQPNDGLRLEPPHTIEDLVDVEQALRAAHEAATEWHFLLASMRETGKPPGWHGPRLTTVGLAEDELAEPRGVG
jgi:hypothetical protein